jgi:hypothetical protein
VLTAVRHAGGHARVFTRRQGQMIGNRVKDGAHFYFIGIGFLPWVLLICYCHIRYGLLLENLHKIPTNILITRFFIHTHSHLSGTYCELMPYPKAGEEPPHYWQFERTPMRQFMAKYFANTGQ